jgi:hypothetical protein
MTKNGIYLGTVPGSWLCGMGCSKKAYPYPQSVHPIQMLVFHVSYKIDYSWLGLRNARPFLESHQDHRSSEKEVGATTLAANHIRSETANNI